MSVPTPESPSKAARPLDQDPDQEPGKNNNNNKRSHEGNSPAHGAKAAEAEGASNKRPRRALIDEKARGRRIFGAMLGHLKASTTPSPSSLSNQALRRREEIVERKKAEMLQQNEEQLGRRKLKSLEERENLQKRLDEEIMKSRHKQLLEEANFLQTKTEPRLFYRPWELRDCDEDIIEEQIKRAEERVGEELAEWEQHQGGKDEEEPHSPAVEVQENENDQGHESEGAKQNTMPEASDDNKTKSSPKEEGEKDSLHPAVVTPSSQDHKQGSQESQRTDNDNTDKQGNTRQDNDYDDHVIDGHGEDEVIIY